MDQQQHAARRQREQAAHASQNRQREPPDADGVGQIPARQRKAADPGRRRHDQRRRRDQPRVDRFKKALGEKVTDVRVSDRLVESPSCVTAEHGQILTAQMRRMLEAAGQEVPEEKFILEINPQHALVQKAAQTSDEAAFAKWAEFIYEEALLSEQGSLKDPNAFVRRLNELLLG